MSSFLKSEVSRTLLLAFPIILNQLGNFVMQLLDTAMVGRLGAESIAAVAFGGNVTNAILIIGIGLGAAIYILVSNATGAKDVIEGHAVLKQGLILSLLSALVPCVAFSWGNARVLEYLGQPQEVVELGRSYFLYLLWSLLPAFIGLCFKNYFEAQMKPWLPLVLLTICIGVNGFLNWILIFGKLGAPQMGVAGAGLATLIARILNTILLFLFARWQMRFRFRLGDWWDISWSHVQKIVRLAVPSFFQILFEWGAYLLSAIMVGWIGTIALASHQIAMNYSSFTYMIPLGLAYATTIRIGETLGRGEKASIGRIAWGSMVCGACFSGICGVIAIIGHHAIPRFFVGDSDVIFTAGRFLVIDGLFLIFDGMQITALGALRGMEDVRIPTLIAVGSYGLIGVVLGYILSFHAGMGGRGIWLALGLSLLFAALFLSLRLRNVLLSKA